MKEFLKKRTRLFLILTIVGWTLQILAMVVVQPWTERLGVAESPQRNIYLVVTTWWIARLPMFLLGLSIAAKHDKWIAPRGRHVEGRNYPLLDTPQYVAIGLMTALFAATGAVSWQVFDLAAAAAAIATVYFGPVVGFFSVWLGGSLRQLLFAAGGNPVSWFLGIGLYDGTTWLYIGLVFWYLRDRFKDRKTLAFVLWLVFYVLFRGIYELDYLVWLYPGNSLWASVTWWLVQFLPTSTLSAGVGGLASMALMEATRGRRRETSGTEAS